MLLRIQCGCMCCATDMPGNGQPQQASTLIARTRHPGLTHFHVHLMEMAQGIPEPYTQPPHCIDGDALVRRAWPSAQVRKRERISSARAWGSCIVLVFVCGVIMADFRVSGCFCECRCCARSGRRAATCCTWPATSTSTSGTSTPPLTATSRYVNIYSRS